jgi:hypothetical protein
MAEFPGQSIGGVNQGGVQPSYYVDAAGNQFWGVQTKLGALYQYIVYKQDWTGAISIAWSHVGGQGNLCPQPDGRLVAVVFRAPGESAPILARTVPGWVSRGS